ncbi:MAG: putative manganese catalase [Chroococcidiopsis cubana SAG 39.79]|jgi:Mn-containing catalase|uniref:Catalase n=2 Tax=Chroococcidiopsis TaxID=54298 RepID=K9TXM6_CHRTP|nr:MULTISPECIES: manganese catalase family protein [Chroococcidiopsis]MBE9015263.1 manganese catalase family protein [Chroococcidiopsidales cyanobacterium LEGE 13417]PSB44163.1 manganese catalase [Cyanosarcina cf. burmensis CCALA 770]AFY87300.1 Catalase [Chroococcidiopsis thermalis PCC 7203]MDZ4874659.1 putative manganese catalase [Chroococcidiopsis cubana SAG 39.79]PSB62274.1 manganese catalase [Chroococcidiopsis cubana CCALA 043]
MFYHKKQLQYFTPPAKPDAAYAKKLQELIGGSFGEMTVMMQYLFQGWNCRGPAKYRDMLLDIGTEEIGHVEMLATMVAHLLDKAPVNMQEDGAKDPVVGAVMGGVRPRDVIMAAAMNPQHATVSGGGAMPADSVGFPWNGRFIVASGNLLADFRSNLHAESQGLLQAVRLYEMTDDPGVRDMLSFNIARDTMHQNQWLAAIEDLKSEGFEETVVPKIAYEYGKKENAYQFWNHSEGEESAQGRWAKGASIDGKGQFEYVANPQPIGPEPNLPQPDPKLHGTMKSPQAQQMQEGSVVSKAVQGVADAVEGTANTINKITGGDGQ